MAKLTCGYIIEDRSIVYASCFVLAHLLANPFTRRMKKFFIGERVRKKGNEIA